MPLGSDPVIVFSGHNVECALPKGVLEGRGIRAFLRDEVTGGTEPFWAATAGETGGVKVIVAAKDTEAGSDVVQEFLGKRP